MRLSLSNDKKAILDGLQGLVISLVAVGIVLVIGFLIMAEGKSQIQSSEGVNASGQNSSGAYSSMAWNSTNTTQEAMSTIPNWLGIIVITVIGAFLIGLVSLFKQG